jgi:hypothetical protein
MNNLGKNLYSYDILRLPFSSASSDKKRVETTMSECFVFDSHLIVSGTYR